MKKFLIVILFAIIVPAGVMAQVKEEGKTKEPATKLETFLSKKGKLIVKDFYKLGTVHGNFGAKLEFSALVIYEPGQDNQRIRGLRVEVTEGGRFERSNTSFLDIEEVESLSKALEYMSTLGEKWKGINKEYTEIIFSTKGDFNIGFYQKGSDLAAFSSSGYIAKASCFLPIQDLGSIRTIVDKGLQLLSEK